MKINPLFLLLLFALVLHACQQNPPALNTPLPEPVSAPAAHQTQKKIKTVGILLYDGFTVLDAMGPYQVLSEIPEANVFFIGKESGLVKSSGGVEIKVDRTLAMTDSLDVLVIPGGFKETYQLQQDSSLLNWVRKIDQTTTYTTSVCTGAWVLAATGLLKGKNATTHWYGKKILREMGVHVLDKRWVQDGKYWTSAGVSAGMDMCFAILNDALGETFAKTAMLDLEYDPQPPFKAGSEQNTEKEIVENMRQMYDQGLKSIQKPVKTTKKSPKSQPAQTGFDNTIDFICGMEVMPDYTDTCHYKGKIYGFCSEYCKDHFLENPLKYLKQ